MKFLTSALLILLWPLFVFANEVKVKDAPAISLDEIGLLNNKQSPLGYNMWQSSDGEFVKDLLSFLPINSESEGFNHLKDFLLLTSARVPKKNGQAVSITDIKFKHLALAGRWQALADIIKLIPANMVTDEIKRYYFIALISADKIPDACGQIDGFTDNIADLFWRKMLVLCQLNEGKKQAVELSISLLKEDGVSLQDEFLQYVYAKDKNKPAKLDALLFSMIPLQKHKTDKLPEISILQMQEEFRKALADFETLSADETVSKLSEAALLADFYGLGISNRNWQNIILYSLSNNINSGSLAFSALLDDAFENNRKGEAALISLLIISNNSYSDLYFKALRVLSDLGFAAQVKILAMEKIAK